MKPFRSFLIFIAIAFTLLLVLLDSRHPALWAQQPIFTPTPVAVTIISHPGDGDSVAGFAKIIGSTLTRDCLKYSLDISSAGRESWQNLIVDYRCVANNELYTIDTKQYKDGYYDLRLHAIRRDGNFEEAFLRGIKISNSYPPTPTPIYDAFGSPLPLPSPTPLPQPTATQRPATTHRIPGGQGFYKPEIGESISGYVDIAATVYGFAGREFRRYDLFISPRGAQQWTWLYSSTEQHWQDTIYVLDSTQFPDGYYDLMLRNVYADSNYDEFVLRYIRIANSGIPAPNQTAVTNIQQSGILAPLSNTAVQGLLEVRGVAVDPSFLRWELYWSVAGMEQWSFLTQDSKPVAGGIMAKLDFRNWVGSAIDLRMRIVRTDFNYSEYFVRNVRILVPPPTATPYPTFTKTP